MKQKRYFKVTTVVYYGIPYHSELAKDEKITDINGYTEQELQNDWFNFPLYKRHATRDSYRIGNISSVKNIEIVDDVSKEDI